MLPTFSIQITKTNLPTSSSPSSKFTSCDRFFPSEGYLMSIILTRIQIYTITLNLIVIINTISSHFVDEKDSFLPSKPNRWVHCIAVYSRTITVVQAKSVAATICDSYYGIGHNFLVNTQWSTIIMHCFRFIFAQCPTSLNKTKYPWMDAIHLMLLNLISTPRVRSLPTHPWCWWWLERRRRAVVRFVSVTVSDHLPVDICCGNTEHYTTYTSTPDTAAVMDQDQGNAGGWVWAGSRTVFCRYIGRGPWLSLIWLHCSLLHFIK